MTQHPAQKESTQDTHTVIGTSGQRSKPGVPLDNEKGLTAVHEEPDNLTWGRRQTQTKARDMEEDNWSLQGTDSSSMEHGGY